MSWCVYFHHCVSCFVMIFIITVTLAISIIVYSPSSLLLFSDGHVHNKPYNNSFVLVFIISIVIIMTIGTYSLLSSWPLLPIQSSWPLLPIQCHHHDHCYLFIVIIIIAVLVLDILQFVSVGIYSLHVSWADRDVIGSPYKVTVMPGGADAKKVLCVGESLQSGGVVGQELRTTIDTRKAGPGTFNWMTMP